MNTITSIILKRIALGFATVMVISVLIFIGVEALPGDLAEAINHWCKSGGGLVFTKKQ